MTKCSTSAVLWCVLLMAAAACGDEEPVIHADVPRWLQEKIELDERYVQQNPKSMLAYGVWVRTSWRQNHFYEYSNLLSSSMYRPISFTGDTLPFYAGDRNTGYDKEKCCAKVVWHGNRIDEEYLASFHGM